MPADALLPPNPDGLWLSFADRFGPAPDLRIFRAPGRINLIGEHTDYSEGFVFPAAIDRACWVAARRNDRDSLRVLTLTGDERDGYAQLGPGFERRGDWTDYVSGVRAALADAGVETPGCDMAIWSDVPEGAGVSSSAALEVSVMLALLAMAGRTASPLDMARWTQIAESRYVGMPCGIMDQFASVHGRKNHALALDCRSLEATPAPIPPEAAFLVVDSGVRHQLTDGGYKARREDCEAAASVLGVRVLRDATPEMLSASDMPERLQRRARHVVEENARVGEAVAALRTGDLLQLGKLMSASHASLRDLFNVTCLETDMLADIAQGTPGVLGARQMGGGFGGAVLALVEADQAQRALDAILKDYLKQSGRTTTGFRCGIEDGAHEVRP